MSSHEDESNLSDDDALSLWVGRVARTHALLEYNVDNVHKFLARRAGREGGSASVIGFNQLVKECQTLLRESDADHEVVTAGDLALMEALEVTARRNRVVHDMWLPDFRREGADPARWNTFKRLNDVTASYASADSRDLTMVIETHNLLVRTRMRVSGLFMALHALFPPESTGPPSSTSAQDLATYVALMTDRFVLHANGDFEVTRDVGEEQL